MKKIRTAKWEEEQMNIHFNHTEPNGKFNSERLKDCPCTTCEAKRNAKNR